MQPTGQASASLQQPAGGTLRLAKGLELPVAQGYRGCSHLLPQMGTLWLRGAIPAQATLLYSHLGPLNPWPSTWSGPLVSYPQSTLGGCGDHESPAASETPVHPQGPFPECPVATLTSDKPLRRQSQENTFRAPEAVLRSAKGAWSCAASERRLSSVFGLSLDVGVQCLQGLV